MVRKILRYVGVALMTFCLSWPSVLAYGTSPGSGQRYAPVADHSLGLSPAAGSEFVVQDMNGAAVCRDATQEESLFLNSRDESVALHGISPVRQAAIEPMDEGLKINLRATQQLEAFPQAKAAFLRAARTWENLIQDPITVVVDVDFGPLRFGRPYPEANVLGSTFSQQIGSPTIYPELRRRLIVQASNPREVELYNALPDATIRSDIGNTTAVLAPSPIFRALGFISPIADPVAENEALGPPPSIGFNSAFTFDFNPDDGIDPGKIDFDAVAVHEIGHALGFMSKVGSLESNPAASLTASVLDLFRLRPGVNLSIFSTGPRILSSGGAQVFFAGVPELELSTGRPDGSAGDGRQASHWKDDDLLGRHIGIMDPTIAPGTHLTVSNNDLLAFDSFGYRVR